MFVDPDSGIWKLIVESGMQLQESRIPPTIRIRNPSESSTWNPEFPAWNPESETALDLYLYTWDNLKLRANCEG